MFKICVRLGTRLQQKALKINLLAIVTDFIPCYKREVGRSKEPFGIATGYGLHDPGSIAGSQREPLLQSVQTDSGAHTACAMGTRGSFPWKQRGRGAKLTIHVHPVSRSRKVELYLHSHRSLHGVVLNRATQCSGKGWQFYKHLVMKKDTETL
jgi:hypothetical protein